jgi:2'-5' RNA ligase
MGKRLFLAINPSVESRQMLAVYTASLHKGLANFSPRWINPDRYHLTLYFFGDVDERKIPYLDQAFSALDGLVPPPRLSLEELIFLPSLRAPRVLSLRFSLQAPTTIDPILRKARETVGGEPSLKPWLPHLSLARFKEPRTSLRKAGLQGLRLDLPQPPKIELLPTTFELMESFLYPGGAEYEIKKSYRFAST